MGEEDPRDFAVWLENTIMIAPSEAVEMVISLTYGIWVTKNKKCYENNDIPLQHTIKKALSAVADYKSSLRQDINNGFNNVQRITLRWTPPPTGWYKMNIDAAGPMDGCWGAGTIIRDSNGKVMAAASMQFSSMDDVELAEAMALRMGIQFVADLEYQNLQVEVDCLNVAQAMLHPMNSQSYVGMVISDCCHISRSFINFLCLHTKRQANHAAHVLALYNSDHFWFDETPECISDVVALDSLPSFV